MPKMKQLALGAEPLAEMYIAIVETLAYEVDPCCPHCGGKEALSKIIDIEENEHAESIDDLVFAEAAICNICAQPTIFLDMPHLGVDEPVFLHWNFMAFPNLPTKSDVEDEDDHARSAEANRAGSNVLALPSPL